MTDEHDELLTAVERFLSTAKSDNEELLLRIRFPVSEYRRLKSLVEEQRKNSTEK